MPDIHIDKLFTDKLVAPLRDAVSMVVVPLQKGMNNWDFDL